MDARRTGLKEGLAEGRTKLLETAKKLLQIGLSFEETKEATGLSIEEIEKL